MLLIGRDDQRVHLHRALGLAAEGVASTTVLRAGIGFGKTALLLDTIESAVGFTVLQTNAFETEREMPFGALFTLLRPILDVVAHLDPEPRSALRGALGLGPPTMADRFAIGVATLQAVAAVAETTPVLIVIDDAQWIDDASRDAIMFVVRRLSADCVATVIAVRDTAQLDFRGLTLLDLPGLTVHQTIELVHPHHVAESVAVAICEACGGNPLAMTETVVRLTARQRLALDPLGDLLPIGRASIDLFRSDIESLAPGDRFGLLLAALGHSPDRPLLEKACSLAGEPIQDWAGAERTRLVAVRPATIEFASPLARTAVVTLADPVERRRAHAALALALAGDDRGIWHRADAANGPDEEIAVELELFAQKAMMRGDTSMATRAATRAAEVSSSLAIAAPRHLLAAQCASLAGLDHTTHTAAAMADGDVRSRSEATIVKAATATWMGDIETQRRLFADVVPELEKLDPQSAAIVLAFAALGKFNELDLQGAMEASSRAWDLVGRRLDIPHPFGLMPAVGMAVHGSLAGAEQLDLVESCRSLVQDLGIVDLATPVVHGMLTANRHGDALRFSEAMFEVAVSRGAVPAAAWIAVTIGTLNARMGELENARSWCERGYDLGSVTTPYAMLTAAAELSVLAAIRGDFARSQALSDDVERRAHDLTIEPTRATARLGTIMSMVLQGDLEAAVQSLIAWPEMPRPMVEYYPVAYELVEALVRLHRQDEARLLQSELADIATSALLGHTGQVERCYGLLADDSSFAEHFERAIEVLADGPRRLELARTHLCYGERLRRIGQRTAAREHLSVALKYFESEGCKPWLERTRAELRLAGHRMAEPSASTDHGLTAQEDQVARAIVAGRSNREIATSLFLSVKTVEAHLTRIYRKIGVRSRTELASRYRRE
jgi:DNA-binding CsgD family transcriptional regulator